MPNKDMNIGYVICEGDDIASEAQIVSENSKRVLAEGVLQVAERQNRNGRVYLHDDLYREVYCPRTKELLAAGYMRGEAGHPMSQDLARQQTIDPANVCVKYTKIWMDGNTVMGQFRGTNNALGEAFDADLRDGDKPAFSLRALGTLKSIGGRNIVQGLRIINWDNVIYPSHPEAYTTRVVAESAKLNSTISGRDHDNSLSSINTTGILIPITNSAVMSYLKSESARVSSLLEQFDIFYESAKIVNNGKDVQLTSKNGDIFVVNLENHIQNEIQDYCIEAGFEK